MIQSNRLAFPTPRYPDYLTPPSGMEELLPDARKALARTVGRGALGRAKPGERILLVTPVGPDQDPIVLEAMIWAFKEKGITAEAVTEDVIGIAPPFEKLEVLSAEDGWKELFWRKQNTAMLPPEIQCQEPAVIDTPEKNRPLRAFLSEHPEYDGVFAGYGGRDHWKFAMGEFGTKFKDNWLYRNHEQLKGRWSYFPSDVWNLVEKKITDLIPRVEEVRVTDPQGTELWWRVTEEEAILWKDSATLTGHLKMYAEEVRGTLCEKDSLRDKVTEIFKFPKAQGVIAGTSNHFGFFPHMKAYVQDGIVVRIEGGGLEGELLREILAKTQDVQYPIYPKPGYLYVTEGALGTNPKFFRNRKGLFDGYSWFPNVWERNRSGVIHWGIGIHTTNPEVVKFAAENGLPREHGWHIHTLFNTYTVKLRDSKTWVTLVDKGHVTSLDDPEVIELASKHGDPSELLREDWIPAIPGINYPGDYMRDYGNDPVAWVRKDLEGKLPATIGVPR